MSELQAAPNNKNDSINVTINNDNIQNTMVNVSKQKFEISSIFFTNQVSEAAIWPKLRGTLIVLVGFPIFAACLSYGNYQKEHIIGVLLSVFHLFYFTNMIYFVYKTPSLYRVYARYKILENWTQIQLPDKMDEYPKEAIKSISEWSAIKGTLTNVSLLSTGLFTFSSYLAIFIMSFDEWSSTTSKTISAAFSFGAGVGLSWLGFWELNVNDKFHKIMHYIGVLLCLSANIGLGICMNWKWIFWLITIPSIIAFILWQYFDHTAVLPSDDSKYVHNVSLKCLICEGIVLLSGALSFDVYLCSCTY